MVTWAIGHLVGLPQPHEIEAAWRAWRWSQLPMLPRRWPLRCCRTPASNTRWSRDPPFGQVAEVVCATDAGREGELIFRYIYEAAGCRKSVERLWISSLTPEAISQGLRAAAAAP